MYNCVCGHRHPEKQKKWNLKNITIINNQYNCGKGNAIKSGVLISRGDVVLITDADLSASIDQFTTLYNKYLDGFDIVIASRSKKDSKVLQRQSIQRVIAGKLFNFFIKNNREILINSFLFLLPIHSLYF